MTFEGALFVLIQVALLANWPVALILIVAAYRRPRIMALTVMAVAATLIAAGITVYVLAIINANNAYPVARETAQIIFRIVILGLALFPMWFLWLFLTGRFRDSASDSDLDDAYRQGAESAERAGLEVDDPVAGTAAPVHESDRDAPAPAADLDPPPAPMPHP